MNLVFKDPILKVESTLLATNCLLVKLTSVACDTHYYADMAELVDASDSKSGSGNTV